MADDREKIIEPGPVGRIVAATVAEAIADIDPDHLNDREVIAYLAGISESATGLLRVRPDLKAHADLVMDLANRVFSANAEAEERGYRKAIADLRGEATRQSNTADDGTNLIIGTHWHAAADFLESKITGSTDGP